jgi:hypothetical protein
MPWTPSDVARHNKRAAKSPKKAKQWSDVANKVLQSTGDEGRAIREANAVANRNKSGRRRNMK